VLLRALPRRIPNRHEYTILALIDQADGVAGAETEARRLGESLPLRFSLMAEPTVEVVTRAA
jgi:hypothetical protein